MTQGRGFSLVELIAAVALLAILASIAVPSFQNLLQRNRIAGSANLLLTHIQLARIRAIMDAATVVICPSPDGATCVADSRGWSQGWLVFSDADYRLPPRLDPEDTLLLAHQNSSARASVNTSLTHLRYSPSGSASMGSFVLCGGGDSKTARAIIVNIAGRARISRTAANGASLSCT
ncbi:MAG: GspH/FimT family pseudopilin [Nevskiales bacterium]